MQGPSSSGNARLDNNTALEPLATLGRTKYIVGRHTASGWSQLLRSFQDRRMLYLLLVVGLTPSLFAVGQWVERRAWMTSSFLSALCRAIPMRTIPPLLCTLSSVSCGEWWSGEEKEMHDAHACVSVRT